MSFNFEFPSGQSTMWITSEKGTFSVSVHAIEELIAFYKEEELTYVKTSIITSKEEKK